MDLKQKVGPLSLETWVYVLVALLVFVVGYFLFYFTGWADVPGPWG
jgi:hypothetical protein